MVIDECLVEVDGFEQIPYHPHHILNTFNSNQSVSEPFAIKSMHIYYAYDE